MEDFDSNGNILIDMGKSYYERFISKPEEEKIYTDSIVITPFRELMGFGGLVLTSLVGMVVASSLKTYAGVHHNDDLIAFADICAATHIGTFGVGLLSQVVDQVSDMTYDFRKERR